MRSKNPALMERISEYAEQYYLQNGVSPSLSRLAADVGVAKTTAYYYLREMADKGMIKYDGHGIQTPLLQKFNEDVRCTAVYGSVPCGNPQEREQQIEEYIPLPTAIFGNGNFFILRADGDSMIDADINDGDLVVIKKQNTAEYGDIVVALVNGQNTLKRFKPDYANKRVILHPENRDMQDIIVKDCQIQGVASHIIKKIGE